MEAHLWTGSDGTRNIGSPNRATKNTRANAHAGTELWTKVWYRPRTLVSPVRGCPVIQAVMIGEAIMLIKPVAAFISSFFICAYFFPAFTFAHRAFCAMLIR